MKKFTTLALLCILLFGVVGCSKKDTKEEIVVQYPETYSQLYDTNIAPLSDYVVYTDVQSVNDYYKNNDYPGNEAYLKKVKDAYKDSRDKIQTFVNGLKNDAKTDDKDLKKMNEDLIAVGENTIKGLDEKIASLDKITDEDYKKTQTDFIDLVDKTVNSTDKIGDKFKDMLKKMNEKLGLDKNTTK